MYNTLKPHRKEQNETSKYTPKDSTVNGCVICLQYMPGANYWSW